MRVKRVWAVVVGLVGATTQGATLQVAAMKRDHMETVALLDAARRLEEEEDDEDEPGQADGSTAADFDRRITLLEDMYDKPSSMSRFGAKIIAVVEASEVLGSMGGSPRLRNALLKVESGRPAYDTFDLREVLKAKDEAHTYLVHLSSDPAATSRLDGIDMVRLVNHMAQARWVYADAVHARTLLLRVHPPARRTQAQGRDRRPARGADEAVLAAATAPEAEPAPGADMTSVLGADVCACVLRQLDDPGDTLRATEASRGLRDAEGSRPLARAAASRRIEAETCKREYQIVVRSFLTQGREVGDIYEACLPFRRRVLTAEQARDDAMADYRNRRTVG